jgi:integrase
MFLVANTRVCHQPQWTRAGIRRISTHKIGKSHKGKQPRVANMVVEDYLRPAAVKAGMLKEGEKDRFGFHNLRHSLASFLVRKGTDVKTVQKMLRHSDVSTTLRIYAHSMSEDRLAAQDEMLAAMMAPSNVN